MAEWAPPSTSSPGDVRRHDPGTAVDDVVPAPTDGDGCWVPVCLVVAPRTGRFHAALEASGHTAVEAGELLGHVVGSGEKDPVTLEGAGTVALLVDHLELVRAGEPLAWFHPAPR